MDALKIAELKRTAKLFSKPAPAASRCDYELGQILLYSWRKKKKKKVGLAVC